jgi:hypothetical protein
LLVWRWRKTANWDPSRGYRALTSTPNTFKLTHARQHMPSPLDAASEIATVSVSAVAVLTGLAPVDARVAAASCELALCSAASVRSIVEAVDSPVGG